MTVLDRSAWLNRWREMQQHEMRLATQLARIQEAGHHQPPEEAEYRDALAKRKVFEWSWKPQWGNLADFALWATFSVDDQGQFWRHFENGPGPRREVVARRAENPSKKGYLRITGMLCKVARRPTTTLPKSC